MEDLKTFCELYFRGTPSSLEHFSDEIQQYATGEWTSGIKNFSDAHWIYFDYSGSEVNKASVCINLPLSKPTDELYVTNIVPLEKSQLSVDEYNAVLRKFYADIVVPYKETHHNIEISQVTDDIFDPTTVITKAALEKLERFCYAANKSTGSSHPCDQERWFDFICQTVDDNKMFDYMTLYKFLQDESYWGKKDDDFLGVVGHFAWDETRAEQLASEYEQACEILQYYKKTRGV